MKYINCIINTTLFSIGVCNYAFYNHDKIRTDLIRHSFCMLFSGLSPIMAKRILELFMNKRYRHMASWLILMVWFGPLIDLYYAKKKASLV